jgi:ribonuclease HII
MNQIVKNRLLIGIDEAGYGPNLGPLVISASVWLVPSFEDKNLSDHGLENLLECMKPAFQAKPLRHNSTFIPLGDSKAIHSAKSEFDGLGAGVGYWFKYLNLNTTEFADVLNNLDATFQSRSSPCSPWYSNDLSFDEAPDPFVFDSSVLANARSKADELGLNLIGIEAKIVDESTFNEGCEQHGNKAGLLSYESISLARRCLDKALQAAGHSQSTNAVESIHLYFDKHGGRNRYQAPLSQIFPETWFSAGREGTERSDYVSTWDGKPLFVSFVAKGDRLLGSALASMTAKWLRERIMLRLNRYWQSHVPGLQATAGYPVDALRFRKAIEAKALELRMDERTWWRSR